MNTSSPISSPDTKMDPGVPVRYNHGTLSYSKAGLITLFLFLLWGDFCFSLMELVVPSILPLKLNTLQAPNWLLGLIVTTIPNLMGAIINPIISFRSDRYRSKWGRRIPFLFGATPFLVLFLTLLGYADPIGRWVHAGVLGGRFSETTVLLTVIGVFMVCFQFFNLFITSVYYYLFNDVVPSVFLGRFMALFKMVGGAAGAAYNFFVLQYADTHMQEIFLLAGLVYLVAFVMMCWKVKEGGYPPPPAYEGNDRGLKAAIKTYASECFTHRFYWLFFLANSCIAMTWVTQVYSLLTATRYMGFDLALIGKVGGISGLIGIALLYPAGAIADRLHPFRVLLVGVAAQVFLGVLGVIFIFMRPSLSLNTAIYIWIGLSAVSLPLTTLYYAAELPTLMRLLPRARYGQFCSANAMVRSIALIFGGVASGAFVDLATKLHPSPEYGYRFPSVWNLFFHSCAAVFFFLLYREWKRLGGAKNFVPPQVEVPDDQVADSERRAE